MQTHTSHQLYRGYLIFRDGTVGRESGFVGKSRGCSFVGLPAMADRFLNVRRWTEMPRGVYFTTLEESELLAEDIRPLR